MDEIILHSGDWRERSSWKRICARLAKAWLKANKDYHHDILKHRTWTQIRNGKWICKNCGFQVSKSALDVHISITGQSREEAEEWFARLQKDIEAVKKQFDLEAQKRKEVS